MLHMPIFLTENKHGAEWLLFAGHILTGINYFYLTRSSMWVSVDSDWLRVVSFKCKFTQNYLQF